jgi:hypothetical protein
MSNVFFNIRITSTGANDLTGANYTFTLYPDYPVDSIQITSRGGGEMATYCQGSFPTFTRYRVQGGQQITINGIVRYAAQNKAVVVPNADVKFTFRNPYYNSAHNGELSTTVKSNSSGAFTATLPVGPAAGENSCTFGNVIWFRHTFDIRDFDIKSGLVNGNWRVTTPPEAVFLLATDERI